MLAELLKHASPIYILLKSQRPAPVTVGHCVDDCFAAPFHTHAQLVWEEMGNSSGSGQECQAFRTEPTKRFFDLHTYSE